MSQQPDRTRGPPTTATKSSSGGSNKFKSKFASGGGSKFLESNTKKNNNNNNNNNPNNSNNTSNLSISTNNTVNNNNHSALTSMYSPDHHEAVPDTNFQEGDGRDVNALSSHQLPLQYRWTLWHTAPQTNKGHNKQYGVQQTWTTNYKQIAQFDTVGTFWQLFNNIAAPSMLRAGSSYHLFKGEVRPEWEDRFNQGGGSWTYRFGGGGGNNSEDPANVVNYAWYYTVLNMIGNNFTYNEDICGIVISIRKNGRGKIELWLKNERNRSNRDEIGRQFKRFSGAAKRGSKINYISHDDNKKHNKNRSYDL